MNWAFSGILADQEGDRNAETVEASERRPIIRGSFSFSSPFWEETLLFSY